jgi:hypothetical protein
MSVWGLLVGLPFCAAAGDAAAASAPADVAAADIAAADPVSGEWQHHKLTFNYVGFTTSYTCDGLEAHVRQILLHLGARKDAKVTATGCPGPYNTPSHSAWVDIDFYTLVPAPDAAASGTIKARWTPFELTPRRPSFMGEGACELIQGMKGVITQNFSLRGIEYRTDCFPHETTFDAFAVKAQALRASPP